jgi:adenylate cyclase
MKSPLAKAVFLGLLIGVAGLVISPFHFALDVEEDAGLGLLFKLRGARQAPSDAVVVSIDKESAENLGLPDNPDKWPRSLHARLTETLEKAGAKVIAFDVHFIEPKSAGDDNLFAEAMARAGNVVLTEPVKTKEIPLSNGSDALGHNIIKVVKPIELFSRSAVATAPFTLPRIPFKVAQYWTFETGAGDSPTVPVVVLQLFAMDAYGEFIDLLNKANPGLATRLPRDGEAAARTIGIKELMKEIREVFERDPLLARSMLAELKSSGAPGDVKRKRLLESLIKMYGGSGSRYINYYGPPGTIATIPYYQALKLRSGAVGDNGIDLRGKAVFVGLSEVMLAERKDSFYTVFSKANGTFISGVEIAATAFANLLADTPVKPASLPLHIIVILLWGLLMGVLCRVAPVGLAALAAVGLGAVYLFAADYQFKTGYGWYPVVVPLFFQAPLAFVGGVVWNYVDVNRERQNIKAAFEHYLPKDVVNQLAKDIAHIRTGSRVVYGTCLFTDAQQYTSLSETMDPQELGRFMNRYYETMFRPVKLHDGCVSGVIGDSMLALWVTASSENKLKDNACRAAIDIHRELERFDGASDAVKLKTRIGLHCGQILLGHIGALDHYEYTPMGDIVNTASRIEGLNKYLGTSVLVSGEVIRQLDGFLSRELGKFRVKGKIKPIEIYELRCLAEEADEGSRGACALFADAMEAFRRRSWEEARTKFQRSSDNLKEDGPSLFYIELCEQYMKSPPGEPWDGVVNMDKK